jgi:hypothetical protein
LRKLRAKLKLSDFCYFNVEYEYEFFLWEKVIANIFFARHLCRRDLEIENICVHPRLLAIAHDLEIIMISCSMQFAILFDRQLYSVQFFSISHNKRDVKLCNFLFQFFYNLKIKLKNFKLFISVCCLSNWITSLRFLWLRSLLLKLLHCHIYCQHISNKFKID